MMADLIRASMFCDVDEEQAPINYSITGGTEQPTKHVTCDVTPGAFCNDTCISSILSSFNIESEFHSIHGEISHNTDQPDTRRASTHRPSCTSPSLQRPSSTNCDNMRHSDVTQRPSCTGTSPSLHTCMEFWTRIMLSSKVDISTFNHVTPFAVFGNDYLHSIVTDPTCTEQTERHTDSACTEQTERHTDSTCTEQTERHTDSTCTEQTERHSDSTCTEQTERHSDNDKCSDKSTSVLKAGEKNKEARKSMHTIPYSYAAIVTAAIYTSRMKSLSQFDIVNRVTEMFPECTPTISPALRKTLFKFIRRNKLFRPHEDGTFSIVPGKVLMSTFCRKSHNEEYALFIHDHLGVPNMLNDTGLEVVSRTRTKPLVQEVAKDQSVKSMKRKCDAEEQPNTSKRACLTMPIRPCFHDDSSNHADDELLQLKDLSTPDSLRSSSLHPTCTHEDLSTPDSLRSSSLDTTCTHEDLPGQDVATLALYPTQALPMVVSPVYIPFIGSVPYVDVVVNGQYVQLPLPNLV